MTDILLVAVNAKFSHTNLAVRYLCDALLGAGFDAEFVEYTINQPIRFLLADIVSRAPRRVLFSCYIWNIEIVRQLGEDLRLLFPEMGILLGGPEVSFDAEEQLSCMQWADAILCGEGELLVADVLRQNRPIGVFHSDGFTDLDRLPFPYSDLGGLQNRVLYYESTRGCPFGCAYCLSSADRTLRRRSLPLVFADLQKFLDARIMQVKFVDRTFNLDAARALDIWHFLAEHDNGITSFQMELGGDLFTTEQLAFLNGVRSGLFQFEIGVQSTCPEALRTVARETDFNCLRRNVEAVQSGRNIHQHLDLIAGLPFESFIRFGQSFDEVFSLRPEQLQLGFLKLLRGSRLYSQREQLGLIHSLQPPYEILCTPQISFPELTRLRLLEEMTETYYNSGRFHNLLEYLLRGVNSPFHWFLQLADRMPDRSVGKYEYYDRLFSYGQSQGADPIRMSWLMRFDLALHERPRRLPEQCALGGQASILRRISAERGLPKEIHLEWFPFDVTSPDCEENETLLAFDYGVRDPLGRAHWRKLEQH